MQNEFQGFWQDISCIKFLDVNDFEVLLKSYKEADILDRCGLPLNGLKFEGV